MRRILLGTLLVALLLASCSPVEDQDAAAGQRKSAPLAGAIVTPGNTTSVTGVSLVACHLSSFTPQGLGPCEINGPVVQTDALGRFRIEGLADGDYLLLIDAGLGTFEETITRLAGTSLRLTDTGWVRDDLLGLPADSPLIVAALEGATQPPTPENLEFARQTLWFEGVPFFIARAPDDAPLVIEIPNNRLTPTIQYRQPTPVDRAAVRAATGPLSRDEVALLDPDLAARWTAFINGDDSAFRDTDWMVIETLRAGTIHAIANTQISAVESLDDGTLLKAVGYTIRDVQSGEVRAAAYLDGSSGDVIEISTGYHLNVSDSGDTRIETGPGGEQFYHYGFSYYRRWDRILPDPIIEQIDTFYGYGADTIERGYGSYAGLANTFGGDLSLIPWDETTADLIRNWQPAPEYPPWAYLPASGTVDVNRSRFLEAIQAGQIMINSASLDDFMRSRTLANSGYLPDATRQEVIDTLLTPYRSGHLFSDMEAAIILSATYDGTAPMEIVISDRLGEGFMVPRQRQNVIYISQDEVANVLLGYPGAINSRWAHEMAHVLDFRAPQYEFRSAGGRVCEPLKYMTEYLWWVQRYPGDAPDWDWLTINSGLALARLLTDEYHNSGC